MAVDQATAGMPLAVAFCVFLLSSGASGIAASGDDLWDAQFGVPGTDPSGGGVGACCSIGADLYVGGSFSWAGGISALNVARWDGTTWYPVGAGTGGPD